MTSSHSTTRPFIAAYYFPNYHPDAINAKWHGPGWTEWDLLRDARPRYEGHEQPKVSAWGEFDESDPAWAAREIDLAADHGLDCFIYDWYWYAQQGLYLHDALERGFLQAPNRDRLKFALMWANHDWLNIHPANYVNTPETLAKHVSVAELPGVWDYIIEHYFSRPEYWTIDGRPWFSIYEIGRFIVAAGGLNKARAALDDLRRRAEKAGLPGLHLNVQVWGFAVLPNEIVSRDPASLIAALGIDSTTTYAWVHHYDLNSGNFPQGSYAQAARANMAAWEKYAAELPVPYAPNVSMGWDPSPRTVRSERYDARGYPWTAVLEGNTPEAFGDALRHAIAFAQRTTPARPIVTINAWNEWTEGSYLLPDTRHGTAYLERIRDAVR